MAQARAWCFTLNNAATNELSEHANERYCIWQREKGENGTEHLQGYIEFCAPMRLGGLKKWLPGAHFEVRRGSPAQAADYCRKEESRVDGPWERGTMGGAQGKRCDLEDVKKLVADGASKRDIYAECSEAAAKYPRFIEQLLTWRCEEDAEKVLTCQPMYDWQRKAMLIVAEDVVDPRAIYWVHDPVGNHGKTHLAKFFVDACGAYYTNGGKAVDLAFAYSGQPIVVFDYVRDAKDYVGYGIIEQLKNGILMSTKYESTMKRFKAPHVFVFANFAPDATKFSQDRLRVWELNSVGEII